MANKTLQEYRKYYRKNHPEWSDAEVERSAKNSFDAQEWDNAGRPSTQPVVGRKPTPTPSPKVTRPPLGTGTVLVPGGIPAPGGVPTGLGTVIAQAGKNAGISTPPPSSAGVQTVDFITSLTKAQMKQIIPWLDKFGASKSDISTVGNAKKYLQNNFPTYVENAGNSVTKLIQLFKDDYIPSVDGSGATGPKSNGVTQYVTEKSPALLKQNVDKFLLETIGSTNIKEESRKKIMDEIEKLVKEGTTTTTKIDKKGKTTVVQTAGYSDERAGAVVERVAKELEPGKYEQQKQLNFFDFMQQAEQMRGGR